MTATLSDLLTDTRARLDETTQRFWLDTQLTTWINEALRDIARRTETILSFNTTVTAIAGTNKYALPSDVIRVHRVEFVPTGQTLIYPLEPRTYGEMDQVWGIQQSRQQSYPSYFVLWGFSPNITMQVWPVPSQGGNFNVYYYRLPVTLANPADIAEIPEGWQDLVPLYVESVAKRKDRDDSWKDAKSVYEDTITHMIDVTRQLHDQSQIFTRMTGAVPSWLYEFDN